MKKLPILIVFMLLVQVANAQPIPPNPTPIDGGLGLLLAAGAAYGIKRWKEKDD